MLAARQRATRLPEPVKKLGRRARKEINARRSGLPVLSVVVPSYNVRDYLGECLGSLLVQTRRDLEVIVVDDGSTDGSWEIARGFAARDHRVSVFRQTNSGQGIARNLGVEHARGRFLTFIDADDTVPPRAFEHMIRTLEKSGSDFCVGSARRFSNNRYQATAWANTVHQKDRLGVSIESFPLAMQDIIACNRMFRTEFWRTRVGGFRGHIAYEDHVPMLTAYVRAKRFDILSAVTYNWRIREDLTSTSQQKASIENLLDRVAVKEEAYEMLRAEAPESVFNTWVARALEVDFPAFIAPALLATDMYRSILSATYRTFLARAVPEAMDEVRFFQKSRAWLVAHERWSDVEAADDYFRETGQLPPTAVEDGRILAENCDFLVGAPPEFRELSPLETRFDGALERVRWRDDGQLELSGWALIRGLSMPDFGETRAWLEETATGARLDLAPEQVPCPAATIWARNHHTTYDGAGYRIILDAAGLAPGHWRLHLEVSYLGMTRRGEVHRYVQGGSAAHPRSRSVGTGRPILISPGHDPSHGFSIDVRQAKVALVESHLTGARSVSGRIQIEPGLRLESLSLAAGRARVLVQVRPETADTCSFTAKLPVHPGGGYEEWLLTADLGGDEPELVVWAAEPSTTATASGLRWRGGPRGGSQVRAADPHLVVSSITVDQDTMVLRARPGSPGLARLRLAQLTNARLTVAALSVEEIGPDEVELVFPCVASVLGGPPLPLPSGNYTISLPGTTDPLPVTAAPGIAMSQLLPLEFATNQLHLRLTTAPASGELILRAAAPLRDAERSLHGQRALQRAYQVRDVEPSESVLFQCYRGEFATDSQRALDVGLQVHRPGLTRYWGVLDHSVDVPAGSVRVLIGSREWYDVLASSRYLCNNIDFDGFFRKRPHQHYLQTFHGYPFKSMGRGFWSGKDFSEERIVRELERRNSEYDAILVPSERAAGFYRSEYDYTGRVLVTGYPRSDFPVIADRKQVRTEVLHRLGIPLDKRVVLYAPTYRDNLTTRTYAARLFAELDLAELTAALGKDVVILLRGHNNNQREQDRVSDIPGVVDVTDYPEINHLTVAADTAILDYSSLRFDWALTGKPMVFFVPDVDDYFGRRPPLFGFRESAPGPLLATTAQVASALADLPGLETGYRDAIAAFNATFNELHDGHATDRVIEQFFNEP